MNTQTYISSPGSRRNRELALYVGLGLLCLAVGTYLGLSKRAVFTLGSMALLLALLVLMVRVVRGIGDRTFFYFVLAALVVRIVMAIVLHNASFVKEADSIVYHAEAIRLSSALLGAGPLYATTVAGQAYGYVYFSSFLYAGLGANSLIPIFINCFVGVSCGAFVYKIAAALWKDRKVALIASFLALFMPGILVLCLA